MQLQSHDELENARPLCLTLCTKYEFSPRWKYLKNHLAEGKGLSQLTPLTRITEESHPQDHRIDLEQFDEHHPDISKKVSETELRGADLNNTKEIDDGGLSPPLLEERPDSQRHKAKTPVDDLHQAEPDIVTLENQSEYHPTATALFDASINAQVANALTDDLSQPQLDPTAIPDSKHNPSEHGDLIDYDNEGEHDEEYNYHGTSTGSSTIQGDVLETAPDFLGRPFNGTIISEHKDEITRLTALGGDSIPVPDDRLISRSASDDLVDDHPRDISDTGVGRNWNAAAKCIQTLKASKYLDNPEMNLTVETEGYKSQSQRTEKSNSIRELHPRRESNYDVGTRYNQSGTIINNLGLGKEEFIHENTGHEPWTSPVNGANETENNKETRDTRDSFLENTEQTSARIEDRVYFIEDKRNQNPGIDLLKNSNDFSIPRNISQIQPLRRTENRQRNPADDDEITYEGDGNDPESSRTNTSKQISELTPPIKRMRSDIEDRDPLETSRKG